MIRDVKLTKSVNVVRLKYITCHNSCELITTATGYGS